jgi:tetratricopeptide (TPR) repeat protein
VLPCGLYLLLFDPAIGMVRDWDLFAMVAVGLVPLSLLGIQRLIRHIPQRSDAAAFAAPAIVLSVVMAAAWIGVNASPDRSAGRFESMFEYDRVHAPYAYENLATYYYSRGDTTGAIRQMKAATALSHNPRQYLALALYYDESGNSTEAMEALKTALASRPDYADARLLATTILAREGRLEELAAYAREGTVHNPGQAILWFHLGQAQILLGNVDDGVAALQSCLGANPTPELAQRARGLIQLYTAEE